MKHFGGSLAGFTAIQKAFPFLVNPKRKLIGSPPAALVFPATLGSECKPVCMSALDTILQLNT